MKPTTILAISIAFGLVTAPVLAQQVQITTPYHSINDSYYENFGVGMGPMGSSGSNGGWFFSGFPANSAPPPFGGYDPAADARFGFRAGPFNFNFLAGSGSNRSHVMQAPTVVIPNGGTGYFFDGSQRPFVMGVVPVVGNGVAPVIGNIPGSSSMPATVPTSTSSPIAQRVAQMQQEQAMRDAAAAQAAGGGQFQPAAAPLPPPAAEPSRDDDPLVIRGGQVVDSRPSGSSVSGDSATSTANHGDISLAEIQQQQTHQDKVRQHEMLVLIEKARGKEAEGKPGIAKIYYQQAASRADGELKNKLQAKINSLGN